MLKALLLLALLLPGCGPYVNHDDVVFREQQQAAAGGAAAAAAAAGSAARRRRAEEQAAAAAASPGNECSVVVKIQGFDESRRPGRWYTLRVFRLVFARPGCPAE